MLYFDIVNAKSHHENCTRFQFTLFDISRLKIGMQSQTYRNRINLYQPIVREAKVQKYMFTYHIDGQFHFIFILNLQVE